MGAQFKDDCNIKIGVNSKNPQKYVNRIAERCGAVDIFPARFVCLDCAMGRTGFEMGGTVDLEKVSCPNCYGDDVWLTQVWLELAEVHI